MTAWYPIIRAQQVKYPPPSPPPYVRQLFNNFPELGRVLNPGARTRHYNTVVGSGGHIKQPGDLVLGGNEVIAFNISPHTPASIKSLEIKLSA